MQCTFLIPSICIWYSLFLRLFRLAAQFLALLDQDDASLSSPLKRSAEERNHSKHKKLPWKMVLMENGQQEVFLSHKLNKTKDYFFFWKESSFLVS